MVAQVCQSIGPARNCQGLLLRERETVYVAAQHALSYLRSVRICETLNAISRKPRKLKKAAHAIEHCINYELRNLGFGS
jgi:hypothetical protein